MINMHPQQHYIQEHVDLYDRIDDPLYLSKVESFARWYESPIDLPGRWYLQAIGQLFMGSRTLAQTWPEIARWIAR